MDAGHTWDFNRAQGSVLGLALLRFQIFLGQRIARNSEVALCLVVCFFSFSVASLVSQEIPI